MKKVCEVGGCDGCPLQRLYPHNTFVAPRIGKGLRLAIAEAPGKEEAEQGEPLVGGSGKWLRGGIIDGKRRGGFYGKAGIREEEITFANTIQCRPPDNVYPTDPKARHYISREEAQRALDHCFDAHVLPLLKSRPWNRIDLIGDYALEKLTGRTEGIMKWRGSPMVIPALGEKPLALPTLHPSYVARDQKYIPVVINDLRKTLVVPPEHYNLYPSIEDVRAFRAKEFVFDIETPKYKTMGEHAPIEMVGLCSEPFRVMVVPFTGAYVAELKRIFAEATDVVGHNLIQFDLPRLRRDGITIADDCRIWDTMLLQHLRFPNLPHDLEFVGSQFSNKPAWKHDKASFELYCARDVDVTMQAYRQLKPMIQQQGLMPLYQLVQVPLGKICHEMTTLGFKQDPDRLREVRTKFLAEVAQLEQQLPPELQPFTQKKRKRHLAQPGVVNAKGKPVKYVYEEIEERKSGVTTASKKKFFYEILGLPEQYNAKSKKISTDKTAIDKLMVAVRKTDWPQVKRDQVTGWLVTLRKYSKVMTLLRGFLKEDYEKIPRRFIHPSFNVHGTSTGRLSSSNPNFQNQPETARYMYVPRHAGWKIIECVTPDTRILTSDLRWKPAKDISVGDELWGFDEDANIRKIRKAVVEQAQRIEKHCYRITTTQGTITASQDHSFLWKNANNGRNYEWRHVKDLKVGDALGFFIQPWLEDCSRDGGWLAGLLDGEGWVTDHATVGFGQNDGIVLDRALAQLEADGFTYERGKNASGCNQITISKDSAFAGLQALGRYRPIRLLHKALGCVEGMRTWCQKSEPAIIQRIEFVNRQEVIALQTTTHTFIAEGFLSHNCDYSGIENRLQALFAGDQRRLDRLLQGVSEHKIATELFFGIPYYLVEKDNDPEAPYNKAKHIVHGTDRGMGAKKISNMYGIEFAESKRLQALWKDEIKATIQWQGEIAAQAKKQGFLANAFGRKAWFYTDTAYTESISFMPQSTGADVIYRAMVGLMYERIGWPLEKVLQISPVAKPLPRPANLLVQVHDALVFEAPEELVSEVVSTVRDVMEQPWRELGNYVLPVSVAVGDSWGEVEAYKEQ